VTNLKLSCPPIPLEDVGYWVVLNEIEEATGAKVPGDDASPAIEVRKPR
jgi:hypothetical protein